MLCSIPTSCSGMHSTLVVWIFYCLISCYPESGYVPVVDSKPNFFQSPLPSRAPTPIFQPNPYLNPVDDPTYSEGHRQTRIRPDRIQALDPEDLFKKSGGTPASPDGTLLKGVQINSKDVEYAYPIDEPGEEMCETARVWKIYVEEAMKFDSSLTEGWNKGVDVLLVFTGLFSAVLTTFIIQAFELLIPDPGEITNELLVQLLADKVDVNSSISSSSRTPSPAQVLWVNGLWFAALACSLSTALISMLAKQWLQVYTTHISGSPRQRARQRQKRWMELVSWHVLTLLNALPLLLHVALLLFFAGIVVLLWSLNRATTFVTLLIVAFAYIFYFASIWLPIIYPNCPYQHPISEHLRRWIFSGDLSVFAKPSMNDSSLSIGAEEWDPRQRHAEASNHDLLDASILIWLLTRSTDKYVVAATLQSIAGLPRDFSATHVLRAAGAVRLVEEGFQSCFEKDTTIDLQWHLRDAQGAFLYCKAWMCLTRGTSEQWPLGLIAPLWKLQDFKQFADVGAIASCAVAVSSVEDHVAQWELLSYISRYVAGEIQLSHSALSWLLDSMIGGLNQWEMPTAVIEKTTVRAVPVLLRLLKHIEDLQLPTTVRSAAGLALYVFTCEQVDLHAYLSEDDRRASHCEIMVKALSAIITNPGRFDVDEDLLKVVAQELSKLASPLVTQSYRFSKETKDSALSSLLLLFMSRRIAVGIVPDPTLADILHLLSETPVSVIHQPALVNILLETLQQSFHQGVASWSVRLLRPLLSHCSMPVIQAFTEKGGISAVLRAAKIGDIDNRRLQVDSWRTLYEFVKSSMSLYMGKTKKLGSESGAQAVPHFESIFKSKLFKTACTAILSHQWWLFEVSGQWIPTFVELCSLRPHDPVWKNLIKVVRDITEKANGGEYNGMSDMLDRLEAVIEESPKRQSSELTQDSGSDDTFSMHAMTMMEQRLAMRSPAPLPLNVALDGSSVWF